MMLRFHPNSVPPKLHKSSHIKVHTSDFALATCVKLRQTALESAKSALRLGQHAESKDESHSISAHAAHVQEALGTLLYMADAEGCMADTATRYTDAPIAAIAMSTVLTLSSLCEKNAALSKALYEMHVWKWTWQRVPQLAAFADETDEDKVELWHSLAWCMSALANFAASREKAMKEDFLREGVVAYAAEVVLLASAELDASGADTQQSPSDPLAWLCSSPHGNTMHTSAKLPSLVNAKGEERQGVKRDALRQVLRFLGNNCFGSAPAASTACGAQNCKEWLADTGAPAAAATVLQAARVLKDVSVARWALHFLSEFSYGRAPNDRQRFLVGHLQLAPVVAATIIEWLTSIEQQQIDVVAVRAAVDAMNNMVFRMHVSEIFAGSDSLLPLLGCLQRVSFESSCLEPHVALRRSVMQLVRSINSALKTES